MKPQGNRLRKRRVPQIGQGRKKPKRLQTNIHNDIHGGQRKKIFVKGTLAENEEICPKPNAIFLGFVEIILTDENFVGIYNVKELLTVKVSTKTSITLTAIPSATVKVIRQQTFKRIFDAQFAHVFVPVKVPSEK
ncbi:hypothetical protein M5689_003319 [Euphorbia peplus]|nr:hypothetical protein M5689_003319 [Euphorbia peplus]